MPSAHMDGNILLLIACGRKKVRRGVTRRL